MAKKRKRSKEDRKKGLESFNGTQEGRIQKRKNREAASDLAIELAPQAAEFLTSNDCCPDKAEKNSGFKTNFFTAVALQRITPTKEQAVTLNSTATQLGWTQPNA